MKPIKREFDIMPLLLAELGVSFNLFCMVDERLWDTFPDPNLIECEVFDPIKETLKDKYRFF